MNISTEKVRDIAINLINKGLLEIENPDEDLTKLKYLLTKKGHNFWFSRKYKESALSALVLTVLTDKEVKQLFNIFTKLYKHILMLFNDREEIVKNIKCFDFFQDT